MWILILLFIGLPLAEILIFIRIESFIGLWPTLASILGTAIVGTALLRQQGLNALKQVQQSLERGVMPVEQIFSGACMLVAGALLLTPGFLTDTIGFMLFIPFIRHFIGQLGLTLIRKRNAKRKYWGGEPDNMDKIVIDANFSEVDTSNTDDKEGDPLVIPPKENSS